MLLRHPGRGHTAGDLVVHVPDADVLVAGDLVEQSGPPAFEDAYPLQWPDAVADAAPADHRPHGRGAGPRRRRWTSTSSAPSTRSWRLAWLIRAAHAGGAPPERVAAEAPFGARPALVAAHRGYLD